MRIVVIGGCGNFGARLCRALASPDCEVLAAGRSVTPAAARRIGDGVGAAVLDCSAPSFADDLRRLAPQIVIHCAGPFQQQDYRVVQASIGAGAHYIDLADGRDFVAAFAVANDAAARAAGVLAVSGASTLPALSSAVVDALAPRLAAIETIDIVIAPGQRAPRGAATLAGVFSYAGRPLTWYSRGAWRSAIGWQELQFRRFKGLGGRWAAACDVPDLALFPSRYAGVQTVEFRAALELSVMHFGLWLAAALQRAGLPLPLVRHASALDRLARHFDRFGGECGGMFVEVGGRRNDGTRARLRWNLNVPALNGPEIPCLPALLLARKIMRGSEGRRGACTGAGLLMLDEFNSEFARLGVTTEIEELPA